MLRAQRGLYAGKQRLTGNSISFSHRKYVPLITNQFYLRPNTEIPTLLPTCML